MVDIQSPTAEIRRGKKKKEDENIMSASAMQGGHKKTWITEHFITHSKQSYNKCNTDLKIIITVIIISISSRIYLLKMDAVINFLYIWQA